MDYQIKSKETIVKTPILDVQGLTVLNPQKYELKRIVVKKPGAVVVVPITQDNQVVLVKQWRAGTEKYMLELPAGVIDPGESPEITAQRELREEIGYKSENLVFLGQSYVSPGYLTEKFHFFLARNLEYSPLPPDEHEDLEIITLDFQQALDSQQVKEDAKSWLGLLAAEKHLKI